MKERQTQFHVFVAAGSLLFDHAIAREDADQLRKEQVETRVMDVRICKFADKADNAGVRTWLPSEFENGRTLE